MTEQKREKFVSLAERRVNKALDDFRLIGNLANRNNYDYSEEDAKKIILALESGVKEVKRKFTTGAPNEDKPFKL